MVEQMIQLAMDDFRDSEMLCGYARQAAKMGKQDHAAFFKERAKARIKQFWFDIERIAQMTSPDDMCRAFMDAQKECVNRMEYEIEHMK